MALKLVTNENQEQTKMATATIQNEDQIIAQTIRDQIGVYGLMTLGASQLHYFKNSVGEPGLTFTARILPFTKSGARSSRPAKMRVDVVLSCMDLYDVTVVRHTRGEREVHFRGEGLDASDLQTLMVALDYDGDETLNPRYI